MTLSPGTKLGPYEIVAPLGAGGMGEVYRARDRKLDRDVAIKVLPQAVASDADRLARFEREAKTLAAVNHPNIAQVFGLEEGRTESGPSTSAIVMELVEGEDLSAIIARGPIPVADAIAIARQIAEALEAAHEQGIVHRDLKPGNVKVRSDGTVKVLDFGLAKAVEAAASAGGTKSPTITSPAMTHAGVVLGTAAYMAPEQAKGKIVDRRADIWSFGAVLYEMLTGTRAFPGEDVTDTIVSIMSREPDWSKLPADTPQSIRTLLKRMLDKDARRRLRDVGEARLLLDDIQNGRDARGDEVTRDSGRGMARAWRWAIPVAAIMLLSIAGFVGWWRMATPAPAAVTRFVIEADREMQFIRTSNRVIALSPDGSKLVYIGNRQLHMRLMAETNSHPIPGTNVDPAEPFFSPDGQWIGFFSVADATVKKIAISGGAPVTLCRLGERPSVGMFQGGDWTGDEILFSQLGKGIMRVSANGGDPEVIIPVESPRLAYGPQRLPGGQAILYSRSEGMGTDRWDAADVVVHSLTTGESKVLVRGGSAARLLPTGHLVYALGGTILAVRFDTSQREVRGGPVPVLEGVQRAPMSASPAAQFVTSQSGTLAFVAGAADAINQQSLALVDRKGTLELLGFPPMTYVLPRISPDGKHLAVFTDQAGEQIIWIAELKPGATLRRLTFDGRNRAPIWSRDSRFITFASDRSGEVALYRQAADGTGTAELLVKAPEIVRPESWHPDDKVLTFFASGDLWLFSPGAAPKRALAGSVGARHSAFSPDGRWLAYMSTEAGSPQIFVQPFPPTGAKFQLTTRGAIGPVWSPDAKQIFFTGTRSEATTDRLMVVDVRTTPTVDAGRPVEIPLKNAVLMAARNYDISPDGQRLLVVLRAGREGETGQGEPINIVLNWFEELKTKVPTR